MALLRFVAAMMKKIISGLFIFVGVQAFGKAEDFNKLSVIKDPAKYYKCKKIWDDSCQDEVFKHFYGKNWKKFKKVIFEYQKAIKNQDISKIVKLVSLPCVQDSIGEDGQEYNLEDIIIPSLVKTKNEDKSLSLEHYLNLSKTHIPQKNLIHEEKYPPRFSYKDIEFLIIKKIGQKESPVIFPFKNYIHAFSFAYENKIHKTDQEDIFIPKIIDHFIFNQIVDSPSYNIPFFNRLNSIKDKNLKAKCQKNWTDQCQDQVMKYFFGSDWKSFKAVILEYQKVFPFHSYKEFNKFFALFKIPSKKSSLDIINSEISVMHRDEILNNYDEFKGAYYSGTEVSLWEASNAPYKDMNFHVFKNGNKKLLHIIKFNENFAISFNLKDCESLIFEPKIFGIFYDIFEMPRNIDKLSLIANINLKHKCQKNWTDNCQDEVIKHLFGEDWKEYKKLLIEYQFLIKKHDPKAVFDLFKLPITIKYGASIVDKTYFFSADYNKIDSFNSFRSNFEDSILVYRPEIDGFLSDLASNRLYKDFNFYYVSEFNDKLNLYFDKILIRYTNRYAIGFEYESSSISSLKRSYKPKITTISIFK